MLSSLVFLLLLRSYKSGSRHHRGIRYHLCTLVFSSICDGFDRRFQITSLRQHGAKCNLHAYSSPRTTYSAVYNVQEKANGILEYQEAS